MRVEGMCDVEVIRSEVLEPEAVGSFATRGSGTDCYICTSVRVVSGVWLLRWSPRDLRRKKASFARQNGYSNVIAGSDFLQRCRKLVIQVAVECIELLWKIQCDDGNVASIFNDNTVFCHCGVKKE